MVPGSSAEDALITSGDRITAFDGQAVSNREELQALIKKTKPETMVVLQLSRNEESRTVQLRLMRFQEWFDLKVREQKRKKVDSSTQ